MKNLHLFDSTNLTLPVGSLSTQDTLEPIVLESGQVFFYNQNNVYYHINNSLLVSYQTNFNIKQVYLDELLNVFYLISDRHIRSVSYENPEKCFDTDLWAPDENLDIEPDDEIVTGALSPDKEHIVLLMKSSLVVTLLSNFKLLSWQDLLSVSDKAAKESVNVGWGKVETQFQGSAKGSTSVMPPPPAGVDSGPPSLAWAQDSTLFAINYYNPNLNTRLVKVFKLSGGQCTLEYTSKPIPGLERHLSWRPHVMSHLTSTQRLPNKFVLTFIEKNTEIKDSFELKGVEGVKVLKWNMDGTVLTVVSDKNEVLLYTNSNWRWYLKQTLSFSFPVSLQWTSPYQCSILNSIGSQLTTYTWSWAVDSERGVVSVIDGAELLVTDFNRGIIPPPMCTEKIACPETINHIIRSPLSTNQQHSLSGCNIILVSSLGNVYKETCANGTSRAWDKLNEKWGDKVGNLLSSSRGKLLAWDDSTLVIVNNEEQNVWTFDLNSGQEETIYSSTPLHIVSVHRNSSSRLIIQLSSREVIVISRNNTNLTDVAAKSNEEAAFTLPELCSRIDSGPGHILSLGPGHTMYDNGIAVLSDVSSFVVHEDWLLVTTLTHRLVLYRLLPGTQVDESQGISRFLERGGTLVTVTSSCSVILQMPRGNLESVTPRPLILDLLSDLLESKQYGRAFEQMRKHRIDLNLIVDYVPPSYPLLVSQVQDPHWLNTLVADLKPDDVTTLDACYAEYYAKCARNDRTLTTAPYNSSTKKNLVNICNALRSALEAQDPVKYAQVILHCHVKSGNMIEALSLAKNSSECLEFLILLHDVNRVYEAALRAYDLDLALQIAGKSQKDPKEYVPYLNQLRSLPTHRMKADIDKQYGDYLSAVRHLASNGTTNETAQVEEECMELIRKHKLWAQTMNVFPRESASYSSMVKEYGFHLELKGRSEEAAVMYERAGSAEEGIRCWVKTGAWRGALRLAKQMNYGSDQLDSLYAELSRSLESKRDVTGLVTMLETRRNQPTDGSHVTRDIILSIVRDQPCLALDLAEQYMNDYEVGRGTPGVVVRVGADTREKWRESCGV
uniref:Elongator complex protein 1 n=1 Tax=Cacopsylla melanoneura TaxID=428564 RepID=A0A8D9A9S6_9HEMI